MVCAIEVFEKPRLNNPILIEGLPGIGFIANIATLHLIHELKAKRFAEIHCAAFQDLAVTTENGGTRSPVNEALPLPRFGWTRLHSMVRKHSSIDDVWTVRAVRTYFGYGSGLRLQASDYVGWVQAGTSPKSSSALLCGDRSGNA